MDSWTTKLRKHSFRVHLVSLTCMMTASALMYPAAQQGNMVWIYGLIGLFILGNLMELAIQ
jgi:hypothetical protein